MKKLLVTIIVSLFIMNMYSANVETDFDIKDIPKEVQYCKIIGTSFGVDTPPIITIDFGQKWIATKYIKKDGKKILFNSMIDTLNFMYQNGWEYTNSYVIAGSFGFRHHYILQRKK